MTRLGRALNVLDADVIGLMEVETLGVLERLRESVSGLGYREAILVEGNDPERGIDVALLSRFPITQIVSHAGETYSDAGGQVRRVFSRDCLECHVALPGGETLVVLVNHFKSKRGGEWETQPLRTIQAVRVRAIADSLRERFPLLAVVGDLNDTPDSPALVPLLGDGVWADLAARDVPEAHRYSFVHAGRPERIDYVLASPPLAARFIGGSLLIPHDVWAKRASDHAPLRATFGAAPAPPLAPYSESLTVAYDRTYPACQPRRGPARINAARFFAHDLAQLAGQVVIATGPVARAEATRGTGVVRLFLGHADPARAFRVTLLPDALEAFARAGIADPAGYYLHGMAQAVGELGFYQGHPEIVPARPAQFRKIR